MSNNELLDIMIENNIITKDAVEYWTELLFYTKVPEGAASWDRFLFDEWNKEPRDTFESIARFYTDDAHTVFQASMGGSYVNSNLNKDKSLYIQEGSRVLEYGSGGGREAFGFLREGANVTICDISQRLLDGCLLLAQKYNKSFTTILITQDIPALPKELYDFVLTIDCLEHVRDPVGVVKELVSSLKPNGYLWNEVFFGGHELSPYHLVEVRHFGQGTEWYDILRNLGLIQVDEIGHLWQKV